MKCIDFDKQFRRYTEEWVKENSRKFKNVDEMEAQMPDIYLRWLNVPADWLGGKAPGMYFTDYDQPDMLIKWLEEYIKQDISVPDQLLERIVELGEASVETLLRLVKKEVASNYARLTALGALREIQSPTSIDTLIDIVKNRQEYDEMADIAAEAFLSIGGKSVVPILHCMKSASNTAKLCFLDVLCNFPGDESIYTYAITLLSTESDNLALIASYLGKLGDPRAIDALKPYLEFSDISYLDYIEVRNAIESLGGEITNEREFHGDPYFESLKNTAQNLN